MEHQLNEPRTLDEFFALSPRDQEQRIAVARVITSMRSDDMGLYPASRQNGVAPSTVLRLAKSALRKDRNGRYVAKPYDHLMRVVVIPSPEGLVEAALTDSREASRLGEYWAAVHRYLETGDDSVREEFEGESITDASGNKFPLLSDLEDLDGLAAAGVLSFESMYARSA